MILADKLGRVRSLLWRRSGTPKILSLDLQTWYWLSVISFLSILELSTQSIRLLSFLFLVPMLEELPPDSKPRASDACRRTWDVAGGKQYRGLLKLST